MVQPNVVKSRLVILGLCMEFGACYLNFFILIPTSTERFAYLRLLQAGSNIS